MKVRPKDPFHPFSYLITPGNLDGKNYSQRSGKVLEDVREMAELGVSAVQIREKRLPARLLYDLAVRMVALLDGTGALCFVNGRFDIAVSSGADGVHLTSTSIPIGVVKRSCPEGFLLGISAHSPGDVEVAAESGADLVVFGPIYPTPGKEPLSDTDPLALLEAAKEVARGTRLIGIGGIDENNFRNVLDAGADGIAAIRLFEDRDAAREVLSSLLST